MARCASLAALYFGRQTPRLALAAGPADRTEPGSGYLSTRPKASVASSPETNTADRAPYHAEMGRDGRVLRRARRWGYSEAIDDFVGDGAYLAAVGVDGQVRDVVGEADDEGHLGFNRAISHQELAELIGTSREMVSHLMTKFRDLGVVAVERRRITVVDRQSLRALAEGDA